MGGWVGGVHPSVRQAPSLPSPCVLPEAPLISVDPGGLVVREAGSGSLGHEEAPGAKGKACVSAQGPGPPRKSSANGAQFRRDDSGADGTDLCVKIKGLNLHRLA